MHRNGNGNGVGNGDGMEDRLGDGQWEEVNEKYEAGLHCWPYSADPSKDMYQPNQYQTKC